MVGVENSVDAGLTDLEAGAKSKRLQVRVPLLSWPVTSGRDNLQRYSTYSMSPKMLATRVPALMIEQAIAKLD